MPSVNYTVRLDESDKKAAEQVFNELGLTLAAGFNVYIKAVARQRRIPFDMALSPAPPDKKLTPRQRKVAHEFLGAMKSIGDGVFSADDESAINDLQAGEYKPTFEERLKA